MQIKIISAVVNSPLFADIQCVETKQNINSFHRTVELRTDLYYDNVLYGVASFFFNFRLVISDIPEELSLYKHNPRCLSFTCGKISLYYVRLSQQQQMVKVTRMSTSDIVSLRKSFYKVHCLGN